MAFASYIPTPAFQTATPPQLNNDGHCGVLQNATEGNGVAVLETPQLNNDGHCGGVAVSNTQSAGMQAIDL